MKKRIPNLVNWENGMLPNASHFRATEDYFIAGQCLGQEVHLTNFNYGLLRPLSDGHEQACEIEVVHTVSETIEIRLLYCFGITTGGVIIHYESTPLDYLSYTVPVIELSDNTSGRTSYLNIILSVDPYQRIPTGEPDNEELPPRYPEAHPEYKLYAVPVEQMKSGLDANSLIIGRIRKEGSRYEKDYNYIPPCTCMLSDADLIRYYGRFGVFFNNIEKASKDIVTKVVNRSDSSTMAVNIAEICKNILRYTSTTYFNYRNTGSFWSPIEIINCFSSLAHLCYNSLNFMEKTEKEDVLKYFYEWSDTTPKIFEGYLTESIDIKYEHDEIRSMMFIIESFLDNFSELWLTLSSLDYIGKHKDNIVVGERVQRRNNTTKSDWSLLD